MTFTDAPAGISLFLDANVFIYLFTAHPVFGPPCATLFTRIELKELDAFTSAQELSDVAHRLMTMEAAARLSWKIAGIAAKLKRHSAEIQKSKLHRQALDDIFAFGVHILPVNDRLVSQAADISVQVGLLSNDALIIAVMREQGLSYLASNDTDFDRVPGITRLSPV